MDIVLLSFCLVSLCITCCMVLLDLSRKGRKEIPVTKEKIPEFLQEEHITEDNPLLEKIKVDPEKQQVDFLRQRIEVALRQQLMQLGHPSEEKQLQCISEMLGEEKKSLSSLNPVELRQLLNSIIKQHKEVRESSMPHSV